MACHLRLFPVLVGVLGLLVAACGDDSDSGAASGAGDNPTVVVTTNILGDVVEAFAGDQVEVVTIMPVGADPHDFQASAQQANQMREADALIVNGAGFEEGLLDVVDAAIDDGTPAFEAISVVDAIEFEDHDDHVDDDDHEDDHEDDDDDHDDHDDVDEDHDDHDHDHEGADPHFFADPARMAVAVDVIAAFLTETVDGLDEEALRAGADAYIAELEALDAEVTSTLAAVADDQRVLVTNHDVFGYFAERYDFEVVGTVIPGGSTTDGASAGALADLAATIEDAGVPAIFTDTSSSSDLADTLADEVGGDVAVVPLFTESLGDADSDGATYLDMVRANVDRIAAALAG